MPTNSTPDVALSIRMSMYLSTLMLYVHHVITSGTTYRDILMPYHSPLVGVRTIKFAIVHCADEF